MTTCWPRSPAQGRGEQSLGQTPGTREKDPVKNFWRRGRIILAAAALVITGLGAAATPVLANYPYQYDCQAEPPQGNLFSGRQPFTSSNETGISASIIPPADHSWEPCDGGLGNASVWVALVPGSGNPNGMDSNTILQVGTIKCTIPGIGGCESGIFGQKAHFFWAYGGCGTAIPTAQFFDITGKDPELEHKYRVDVYSTYFDIVVDGGIVFTSNQQQWNGVSCWATGTKDFQIMTERKNHNDAFGGPNYLDDFQYIYNMRRKYGNVWYDLSATTCDGQTTADRTGVHSNVCVANGTYMEIWTN